MTRTNTSTHAVLELFRDGQPHTQLDIEEASGLKAGLVWTNIDRLRLRGDIERVVCGCRCVKHQITAQGVARLSGAETANQARAHRQANFTVASARKQPNSVFALGSMS